MPTLSDWTLDTKRFTYYREDDMFVGWLEEYPDFKTQGETLEELQENLRDIYRELSSGEIPCVRQIGELTV